MKKKITILMTISVIAVVVGVYSMSIVNAGGSNFGSYTAVVNKGTSIDLFDYGNHQKRVGSITKNEVASFEGGAWFSFIFRDGSGKIKRGDSGMEAEKIENFYPITDFPYSESAYVENPMQRGENYYLFKFRRKENIYVGGNVWGQVAAGMSVACLSSWVHEDYLERKHISFVQRSSDNAWIKVPGGGFVDMGYDHGTMPNTISMYGSW